MSDLGPEEVSAAFSFCNEAGDDATWLKFRKWWKRRGFAGSVTMNEEQFAMCSKAVAAVRKRRTANG